ncbi:RDD family protein [Nocardia sp. NPDC051570]|uniref:RDD family protein n=1 Tax=Nocardia sp. NPDC051570 TaxID=3364324 RepID=UPI0037BC1318
MTDPHAQQPNPPQPGQSGAGYPQQPGYGTPPPGYGPPEYGYGAGQPGYSAGQPGYGPGQSGYGAGQPGYGPPQPGYGAPQPGYGAPQPGYGAPQPGYGPPQPGYPPMPGYQPYGPVPPYASWAARVGATLIDGLIIGVPTIILYTLGIAIGTSNMTCTSNDDTGSYSTSCSGGLSAGGVALMFAGALVALVGGLYLLYREGVTGQTPGKKVLGIKLIREADGQTIGFGMSIVRRICHVVDGLPCYLGYLWPLWDDKRQTFADKILHTIVVKL